MLEHTITVTSGVPARCCRSHSTTIARCTCGWEEEVDYHTTSAAIRGHKIEILLEALKIKITVKAEVMDIKEVVKLRKEMGQI